MLIEIRLTLLALGALFSAQVWAVQSCELNGESVSRANGHTTAGKSGVMRCTDDSGQVRRLDQTLRDGKYVGPVLMVLADGERRVIQPQRTRQPRRRGAHLRRQGHAAQRGKL